MKHLLPSLAIFILFCSSCSTPVQQEGTIHYTIAYQGNLGRDADKMLPSGLLVHFKNNKLRAELQGGTGALRPVFIIDGPAGTITRLYPAEQLAESRDLLKKDTSVNVFGAKTESDGMPCRIFKAKNKNAEFLIWSALNISFTIKGCSRQEGFYLDEATGLPLHVEDHEQDYTVIYHADHAYFGPVPDSLFRAPAGYRQAFLKAK